MPDPDFNRVPIGSLRWEVTIATRTQLPDPSGPGLTEALSRLNTVRADVQPIGALTFYAGAQTDRPVTHRIRTRWLDYVDETCVVLRATVRQDGSPRYELFRVRRVKEIDGRKRFVELECELERMQ
jgi:head-tail adaptor